MKVERSEEEEHWLLAMTGRDGIGFRTKTGEKGNEIIDQIAECASKSIWPLQLECRVGYRFGMPFVLAITMAPPLVIHQKARPIGEVERKSESRMLGLIEKDAGNGYGIYRGHRYRTAAGDYRRFNSSCAPPLSTSKSLFDSIRIHRAHPQYRVDAPPSPHFQQKKSAALIHSRRLLIFPRLRITPYPLFSFARVSHLYRISAFKLVFTPGTRRYRPPIGHDHCGILRYLSSASSTVTARRSKRTADPEEP